MAKASPASRITISLLVMMVAGAASVDTEDAILLFKFKDAIKEDPTNAFYSWRLNSPARPCDWEGVQCDVSVLKTGVPVVRAVSLPNRNVLGTLWKELGRLRFLRTLNLTGNRFQGQLPSYVGDAIVIETLDLSNNAFTGTLPAFQKLTYLKTLILSNNQLEGDFPGTACDGDALRVIDMSKNLMRGTISKEVFKCSKLEVLKLSDNALHGDVPAALGELTHLRILDLARNQLTGGLPEAIGKMEYLTHLLLNDNYFTGFITPSISAATYMTMLDLSNNQIGKSIPESLGSLAFLERLSLSNNKLQGFIPQGIGKLTSLVSFLDLSHNMLTGSIPSLIENLERLQKIDLSNNRLSGALPESWGGFYSLSILDLSSNRLNGSMPASMQGLPNIQYLNFSHNEVGGDIPLEISNLITLSVLDLSDNSLTGPIPDMFGSLSSLTYFDGSHNKLTGSLPRSLENLTYIDVFDVSHNDLSGLLLDIPLFQRFAESGYLNDEKGLCGPILNITCASMPNTVADIGKEVYKFLKSKEDQLKYIPLLVVALLGVGTLLILLSCLFLRILQPKLFEEAVECCDVNFSPMLQCCGKKARLSYMDLRSATEHFCNRNIIGFGSRYKVFLGELPKQENVAIKVLNHELFWETWPHFLTDCRVLRKADHTNVMQLLDWCYKPGFLAVVYKYMSKGSLYDNLYGKTRMASLSWKERLGIAVDVALGLAFLHRWGNQKRFVFCQLCPSNILLDENCGAKVAGLQVVRQSDAVVVAEGILNKKPNNLPDPRDFINYLAPECTSERQISERAEVYSYGLTLLELITRKRSAVGVLSLDKTLPARMRQLFPHRVKQLVDTGILRTTIDSSQVLALIEVALLCTEEDPSQRPDMESVVSMLTKLKNGEVDTIHFRSQERLEANVDMSNTFGAYPQNPFQPFPQGLFSEQYLPYQGIPNPHVSFHNL